MFGLGAPELIILLIIVAVGVGVAKSIKLSKEKTMTERRCLVCQYSGPMKTWLSNYNLPQFIAIICLLFYVIPGLVFIGWGWGKFKCPKCGALAKNVPVQFKPETSSGDWSHLTEKKCPFCAENIKPEAIVCRFCNRELPS
jgi:hypothetical protein